MWEVFLSTESNDPSVYLEKKKKGGGEGQNPKL